MVWPKAVVPALLFLSLAACASEGDRAAEAFELAEKNYDYQNACEKGHEAKDAYLAEGDEENYRRFIVRAYNACEDARRGIIKMR